LYGYTTSLNQTKPVMVMALGGLFNVVMNWLLIYGHFGLPQLGASGCARSRPASVSG
jgi:MATE family multidrug resistance protein